jgi:hypothetical protein
VREHGPGRRKLSLKKLRKTIDNPSILCYNLDTVKKGGKKMKIYKLQDELNATFFIKAETKEEALKYAKDVWSEKIISCEETSEDEEEIFWF